MWGARSPAGLYLVADNKTIGIRPLPISPTERLAQHAPGALEPGGWLDPACGTRAERGPSIRTYPRMVNGWLTRYMTTRPGNGHPCCM